MNQSIPSSSSTRTTRAKSSSWLHLLGAAALSAVVLVPGVVAAKERKSAPPAAAPSGDIEARSKELMKKHFPLEEDIGPLPVVRVPKAEDPPKPVAPAPTTPAKVGARGGRHRLVRANSTPLPVVASRPDLAPPPAPAETPEEKPPAPPPPPPKKVEAPPAPPREGHVQASALGSDESKQIDSLLSHALTDSVPAPGPADAPAAASLPRLGMAAIKDTMEALQPEVKRNCRLGRLGVVQVRVDVTPSGDVQNVTAEGKLAATPPAACVVERVKRAHFPRSGGGNFQYTLTVR